MTRPLPLLLCLTACVAPPPRIGLAPVPTCHGCLPAYPSHDGACVDELCRVEQPACRGEWPSDAADL